MGLNPTRDIMFRKQKYIVKYNLIPWNPDSNTWIQFSAHNSLQKAIKKIGKHIAKRGLDSATDWIITCVDYEKNKEYQVKRLKILN